MLLNILQCTGQPPSRQWRLLQTPNVTRIRVSVKHLFHRRTCQSLYWEEETVFSKWGENQGFLSKVPLVG